MAVGIGIGVEVAVASGIGVGLGVGDGVGIDVGIERVGVAVGSTMVTAGVIIGVAVGVEVGTILTVGSSSEQLTSTINRPKSNSALFVLIRGISPDSASGKSTTSGFPITVDAFANREGGCKAAPPL